MERLDLFVTSHADAWTLFFGLEGLDGVLNVISTVVDPSISMSFEQLRARGRVVTICIMPPSLTIS